MPAPELRTSRLVLRQWTDADLPRFAAMNADPRVMKFFPALLSREESDAVAARIRLRLTEQQFGLWAVEIPGVTPFAGFVGLSVPMFSAHFTPCVEVGWRMIPEVWGNGYATEGAHAALDHGFRTLGLEEIVSFTATLNLPSEAVMKRLGMQHNPAEDFDHPVLSPGHPLERHVLYRMKKSDWLAQHADS